MDQFLHNSTQSRVRFSILIEHAQEQYLRQITIYYGVYLQNFKDDFKEKYILNSVTGELTELLSGSQEIIYNVQDDNIISFPRPKLYQSIDLLGQDCKELIKTLIQEKLNKEQIWLVEFTQDQKLKWRALESNQKSKIVKNQPRIKYADKKIHRNHLKGVPQYKSLFSLKTINKFRKLASKEISINKTFQLDRKRTIFINGIDLVKNVIQNINGQSLKNTLISYVSQTEKFSLKNRIFYQSISMYTHTSHEAIKLKVGAEALLSNPDLLIEEINALYELIHIYNYQDVRYCIPYVRNEEELSKIKIMLRSKHLTRSNKFKIFVTLHVPAAFILIDKIIDTGIDGVLIDLPLFIQLFYGIDYKYLKDKYQFLIRDQALLNLLSQIITKLESRNIPYIIISPDKITLNQNQKYPSEAENFFKTEQKAVYL